MTLLRFDKRRGKKRAKPKAFSSIVDRRSLSEKREAAIALRVKSGRPKQKNPKRRESEFGRCYHSRERVKFVAGLPCFATGRVGGNDNTHVIDDGSKGMGRKSGYACIAPLSRDAHRLLHCKPVEFQERYGPIDFAFAAAWTEACWLADCNSENGSRAGLEEGE